MTRAFRRRLALYGSAVLVALGLIVVPRLVVRRVPRVKIRTLDGNITILKTKKIEP